MLKKKIFPKLILRILKYFVIIISIMFLIIISSMKFIELYNEKTLDTFNHVISVQELIDSVSSMTDNIKSYYIQSKDLYLQDFLSQQEKAIATAENLHQTFPKNYYYRDIHAMLQTYNEDCQYILAQMQNSNTRMYAKAEIIKLESLSRYIFDEAHKAMAIQLSEARARTSATSSQIKTASISIYFIIILVTLLCVFFSYRFSKHISMPIISLVDQCKLVAKGNLKVQEPEIRVNDEVNALIRSFNHMVKQLDDSMEEIKQKSKLEKRLARELLKNTEMTVLLRQSELKFLQMQINPHFLFNTLNSISALADIEMALSTKDMVTNLSSLVRYTISEINNIVTLDMECGIIENYLSIQKVRFGSRLSYDFQIAPELRRLKVPSMILQPLVENAIIHGIEPCEAGGHIQIETIDLDGYFVIILSDNGCGMDDAALANLLSSLDGDSHDARSGIGLSNVWKRLNMIYGYDAIDIESAPGVGTSIRLCLQKEIRESRQTIGFRTL